MCAAAVTACLEDRPRPSPPRLSITLARDTVHSPDTLTGEVRADDADGIDSIWLSVDSLKVGDDGFLQPTYLSPFRLPIASGHVFGDRVPVSLMARDAVGFTSTKDTFVLVRGP